MLRARVTGYTISDGDDDLYKLTVEYRGDGRWAILDGSLCLSTDLEWDFEPMPSSRTDEWLLKHRFEAQEAIGLAMDQYHILRHKRAQSRRKL